MEGERIGLGEIVEMPTYHYGAIFEKMTNHKTGVILRFPARKKGGKQC